MKKTFHLLKASLLLISLLFLGCQISEKEHLKNAREKERSGDYRGAIDEYNEAIKSNGTNAETYYERAFIYLKLSDTAYALEDFNKAIELNPNFIEARSSRGNLKYAKDDFKGALEDYKKLKEIAPNSPGLYANIDSCDYKFKEKSDWDEAVRVNTMKSYDDFCMHHPKSKYYKLSEKKVCEFILAETTAFILNNTFYSIINPYENELVFNKNGNCIWSFYSGYQNRKFTGAFSLSDTGLIDISLIGDDGSETSGQLLKVGESLIGEIAGTLQRFDVKSCNNKSSETNTGYKTKTKNNNYSYSFRSPADVCSYLLGKVFVLSTGSNWWFDCSDGIQVNGKYTSGPLDISITSKTTAKIEAQSVRTGKQILFFVNSTNNTIKDPYGSVLYLKE